MSGAKRTHVARTIVEITTEDGSLGVGETRGDWSAATIRERFAPLLVGRSAADRSGARAACVRANLDYGFPEQKLDLTAFAAVDLALWDLLGKRAGLPVYALLGGPVRNRAPFGAYAYTVNLDEGFTETDVPAMMAELADREIDSSGARIFETKIGVHSPECEIAVIWEVHAILRGRAAIAVDANMGYDLETARRVLRGVPDFGLENFEEPVASLADMARLRREFPVPVSTHCTDLDALSPYPEIDSVVGELHGAGGIDGLVALAWRVAATGRAFWLRSMWELGVSWAAMCHLGLALPTLRRPAQTLINWVEDDLILGEPWLVRDGGVRPPDAPGLGVELDREALKRYATG